MVKLSIVWLVLAGWQGLRSVEIARLRRERVLETLRPPALLIARGATKGTRERVLPLSGCVLADLRAHGLPSAGYLFLRRDHRGAGAEVQVIGIGEDDPRAELCELARRHRLDRGLRAHRHEAGRLRPNAPKAPTGLESPRHPG